MALPYVTPAQLDKAVTTLETEISKGGSDVMHSEPVEILVTEEMYNPDNNQYVCSVTADGLYSIIGKEEELFHQDATLVLNLNSGTMIISGASMGATITEEGGTSSLNPGVPCCGYVPMSLVTRVIGSDVGGIMLVVNGRVAFIELEYDV